MQNRTGWSQPASVNNQSSRLRSSRPMPAWMQVSRGGPPPPPPPEEQPVDPDYEVIDFGNSAQIYSNTPAPSGNNKSGKRCDLCGSSAPAVRCVQCIQNFCLSCDHMYHRHPKRQAHVRKELQDSKIRPPLPPKGESAPAPVPPPRRNKTGRPPPARPAAPPLQRDQEVKSPAVLNSLKRALPSRPMPSPPFPSMQNGMQPSPLQPAPSPLMSPLDPHKHLGNMGASEWDVNRRARAGSFSNATPPGFSPMMHAQSMAQLNSPCPSCHFHGPTPPPMSPWGNMDPWGTWGAMPPWQSQSFLNQPSVRVSSRRGSMRRRRQTSSGSEEEDDRMSRRGGNRRGVSPTPSRRSRAPPSDYESEEEEEGAWEPKRGGILPRRESLIDVNRSPNRRERDDDTMSVSGRRFSHATMSRAQKDRRFEEDQSIRNRRNTTDKIPYADDDRMTSRGHRVSDSEESPRETSNSLRRKSSRRSEKLSDSGRRRASPARSYYTENPSDSPYDEEIPQKKLVEPEVIEDTQNSFEPDEEPETEWDPVPDFDWECVHCTFVNSPGIRVCVVCCKTNPKPKKHVEAPVAKVTEQMKSTTLERTGSSRRTQDRYQDRQKQNGMHDERMQERPRQKQEAFSNRQLQHQDSYNAKRPTEREQDRFQDRESYDDRIQERSYKKQESNQELHQRQQSVVARQESFNSKRMDRDRQMTERDDKFQERVITPEKLGRGTSPMTSKRAQEPIRIPDGRSPSVRTPDTKTSDSSSYSSRNVISKGTSPPPQSISTQTYEAPVKLKRATSLADYSEWRAPQRTYSRQSLLSDTQSLPVTPPKGRSPERFPDMAAADIRRDPEPLQPRRRAGSQPPDYISTLVQKQVKQGLEMVKLLREAEEQKFSADDLAVALLHCEDGDPVSWLQQNWRNMIDTVVTLATNYGHERKENTVGTISASEARDNLRMHDGNVWAAVTECVEQRQKKYAELLSRGNFSREDIVTVLTANHGNLEAAYTELSKSQLKPFLMKIWGPPQGVDNDSGNFTKLAHDESKGAGQGGVDQEEVSFNDFNRDRVQTWIDNTVPKSKLSQSMLHLNLIGSNKTIEKLEALSNLSKTEKRDLRARRTSDVHRYLTQFFTLNDNSLKISKSFTSMQDVNKPQIKNTNTLWKFLEKNIGFASSGTLLTVSTTSSNVQAKSIGTDFDTDSLNEDRSGDGEIPEMADVREMLSQVSDVKIEIEGVHDDEEEDDDDDDDEEEEEEANDEENDKTLAGNKETSVEPVVMASQRIEDSTSPVRQIFVKSITVSSEGSTRSVSPQHEQNPEADKESLESASSGTGSFESVEEDSEGKDEVDMNLDRNSESKDAAVLGKLILREEVSPVPTSPQAVPKNGESENHKRHVTQQGTGSGVIEQVDPDDDNNENEEEIMQMVENLIQKTEFMQEEPSAESNKSISVMYTNKDLGVSSLSLKKSNSSSPVTVPDDARALPQAEDEKGGTDGDGGKDKEVVEVMRKGEYNGLSKETSKTGEAEVEEADGERGLINGEFIDDKKNKLATGSEEVAENITEQPIKVDLVQLEMHNSYEGAENDGDANIKVVLANPVKTENVENVSDETKVIINGNDTNLDTPLKQVAEEGLEDNPENEIFEEPPEMIIDGLTRENILDLAVAGGLNTVHDVPLVMGQGKAQDGGVKVEDESGGLKNNEEAQQPINVESSSGTPQTALNMAETDSKSIATNQLQMSEGNSERDVSPIPTDSEKDPSSRFQQEGHKLSRAKSSYELSIGDVIENKAKLSRTASSNELVNLLRESLAKDDVVERIVSTLFQSVLRANEFQLPSHSRDASLLRSRHGSSLSRDMSFRGTSESERDDSELYYEAVETREVLQDKRGRRQFRRRGRNSRRRGTSRKTDESSIVSTSTDNYSNLDGNSRSTSPADIVDYIDETEREARRLLAEGIVSSYDQAELVVQLKALNFSQEDSLVAAKECSSMEAAIAFLQQECDLCAGKYCMKQMVSMLECEHICCRECAQNYFTLQITERSVGDCVCPFCKEPDIGRQDEDGVLDYFAHLDIFLKALVSENTHELFQRKLRDRTLMSDPHFKWCIKCSSGFIANPKQRKLICPDCRTITCAHCRRPWEKEHEKMTCEEFAAFKNEGEPEDNQVEKHLAEGGVTCPKCHQRYLLAKGGCMHLTCPGCKHEFCSGCTKPFLMGAKCAVSANCERLGLHSHHPRNCLFYLRDKDPPVLENLLKDHGVELAKDSEPSSSKCKTQLLKETTDGLVEGSCGHPVEGAGLCRRHYVEHLSHLIRGQGLETIPILETGDLETVVRRTGRKLPPNPYGSPPADYRQSLIQVADSKANERSDSAEWRMLTHYIEHLVDLVKTNKIDPVEVMDATDAVQELRRHGKDLPIRPDFPSDKEYLNFCIKIISEEIPLE